MANTNYTKRYSILGVFQDDDWETIRAAYKRQIRRWHPDRFQDPDHWKIAEEKSKEINRAYQDLADYYQEFGVLPPDQTPERSPAPTTQREWADTVQPAEPRHDDYSGDHRTSFEEPERPGRRGALAVVIVGIVLGAGYLLSEPLFIANPESVEQDISGEPGLAHPESSSAANHGGDDKAGDSGILSPSAVSNSEPDAPETSWTDKDKADDPVSTVGAAKKDKPHLADTRRAQTTTDGPAVLLDMSQSELAGNHRAVAAEAEPSSETPRGGRMGRARATQHPCPRCRRTPGDRGRKSHSQAMRRPRPPGSGDLEPRLRFAPR